METVKTRDAESCHSLISAPWFTFTEQCERADPRSELKQSPHVHTRSHSVADTGEQSDVWWWGVRQCGVSVLITECTQCIIQQAVLHSWERSDNWSTHCDQQWQHNQWPGADTSHTGHDQLRWAAAAAAPASDQREKTETQLKVWNLIRVKCSQSHRYWDTWWRQWWEWYYWWWWWWQWWGAEGATRCRGCRWYRDSPASTLPLTNNSPVTAPTTSPTPSSSSDSCSSSRRRDKRWA